MFCRWRKASTCKKLLQQLQSRLKLLINKKYAISRDLRSDIVIFIRFSDSKHALRLTEPLFLVKNSVIVYELLLQFTNHIILHFSSIEKHRKLFNDEINKAVSSLVFASASCGEELRELVSIRELFCQRFGQSYVTSALQLLPGNLVNLQMKEILSITSVSEDVKSRLLNEIAKEYGHRLKVLRLEYKPEIDNQVNKEEEKKVMDSDLNSCSDEQSPDEVYKSSLSDFEEEISEEETSMEDDYIEEAQVGRDQRVFRFKERSEEKRRSSSSSLSSIKELCDMETITYYKTRKRTHRRRRSSTPSPHCCDIVVYNEFNVTKEEQEEIQRVETNKHVHPKLPDYDQMVNQIKAVKAKEEERRRLLTQHVHPKLPDYDQLVTHFRGLKKQQCMRC